VDAWAAVLLRASGAEHELVESEVAVDELADGVHVRKPTKKVDGDASDGGWRHLVRLRCRDSGKIAHPWLGHCVQRARHELLAKEAEDAFAAVHRGP